jgi:hypothetical protein
MSGNGNQELHVMSGNGNQELHVMSAMKAVQKL